MHFPLKRPLCALSLAAALAPNPAQALLLAQFQQLEGAPQAEEPARERELAEEPGADREAEDDAPAIEEVQPERDAGAGEAAAPEAFFSAEKDSEGVLSLSGQVPDAATLEALSARADDPLADVVVDAAMPRAFAAAVTAGLDALERLSSGRLTYRESAWSLEGQADTEEARADALAVLEDRPEAESWSATITVPGAEERCREEVEAYMADKSLLFGSGSARPTAETLEMLPELAERLNICPETTVHVEGHTDSEGLDASNLNLSVARAEAIVDALIDLGVAANRLYAVGYGASLPIASNATAEGRRQNRRIVFSFEDRAEQ